MDTHGGYQSPDLEGRGSYFYPRIDYREHPAFRDLGVPLRSDEKLVNSAIAEIDVALADIARTPGLSEANLTERFKRGPQQKIDALRAHLIETTANARLVKWLSCSFDDVCVDLLEEARVANARGTAPAPRPGSPGMRVASDLKRDGAHICWLDSQTLDELRRICAPDMELLREQAKQNPNTRVVKNFERYAKTGKLLNKFFKKM